MPLSLDYASPQANRKPSRFAGVDSAGVAFGVVQLLIQIPALLAGDQFVAPLSKNRLDAMAGQCLYNPAWCCGAGAVAAMLILIGAFRPGRQRMHLYLDSIVIVLIVHLVVALSWMEREATMSDYLWPVVRRTNLAIWAWKSVIIFPTFTLLVIRLLSPWDSICGPDDAKDMSVNVLRVESQLMTEKAARFRKASKRPDAGLLPRSPLDVQGIELTPPITAEEIVQIVREGHERG